MLENPSGMFKLTDLRTCSAPWTLPKLLILSSSADRFRLQNPRILLNLTVPDSVTQFLGWQRGRQRRHRRISTVAPTLVPMEG